MIKQKAEIMTNVMGQLDELDIEDIYDYTEKKYFEYGALHEAIEIVKGGADNVNVD